MFNLSNHKKPVRRSGEVFWTALLLYVVSSSMGLGRDATPLHHELDQITYAVDGAESSHGTNPAMWRPNSAGPQGPMQVTDKAARDVGGGDRFDVAQNRALGRAYLALLYRRYGNWPDTVSAYNWGMGNLDNWIRAGRLPQSFVPAVAIYSRRVLTESGVCEMAHPNCTGGIVRVFAPYVGVGYHGTIPRLSRVDLVLPGLERSGQALASLAASGAPLPSLRRSGSPMPILEQSGRSLSRSNNRVTSSMYW
jgi:hypothetical protein